MTDGSASLPTSREIERAVRDSYGRLVAILAARDRDVAAAEDALSDALLAALQQWPAEGIPANPEAWLLAVARRREGDSARRQAVRDRLAPDIEYLARLAESSDTGSVLPDRRAELLFACADPSIDSSVHTPLMLQAVLGLEAATIASAYLTSPASMAQRLVRAKRKIRDAGIPFRVPETAEHPARVLAVLEALYGAFGTAWEWIDGSNAGGTSGRIELRDEAIHLTEMIIVALPEDAEAHGLLALMLYCRARDHARRGAGGEYTPLDQQAPSSWDGASIDRAERTLVKASRLLRGALPGRFQTEAAIQSAHMAGLFGRPRDDAAIALLYDHLVGLAPTVSVHVNRAAAHGRATGAEYGLRLADELPLSAVQSYQPWWALRAHLLRELGREEESRAARSRAAALTDDPAVRDYLKSE